MSKSGEAGWVYILYHPSEGREGRYTKIGFSTYHPEIPTVGRSKPRKAHLDFILNAFGLGATIMPLCEEHSRAREIEKRLHKHFAAKKRSQVGSAREIFDVCPEEVISQFRLLAREL